MGPGYLGHRGRHAPHHVAMELRGARGTATGLRMVATIALGIAMRQDGVLMLSVVRSSL